MGLLVLAGVAALVLTLLALLTIALVQLVLLVTLRNTMIALAVVGFYWFVSSRRRQVAKGFYSCTEVPGSGKPAVKAKTMKPTREKRKDAKAANTRDMKQSSASATPEAGEENANEGASTATHAGEPLSSEEARASDGVGTTEGVSSSETEATPLSTGSDGAESSSDEVPVAAAAATSSASSSASTSPRSGMQLPGLRRHRWKFPSHSMPLKPKGEALLHHGRRSTGGSASNSPRGPELYGSPRSVAAEQKLMKTALESDGYFIGDFRVPPPPVLPKRSQSLGARPKTTTASTNATNTATYTTHTQRTAATAPRAV